MFKKTIKFKDFNGVEQEKDFYFHLSKGQLLEMAADGEKLTNHLENIVKAKNNRAILAQVRELIEMSCGIRSEDGSQFVTTPEAKSELLNSPAYDELLVELATDAEKSAAFFNELIDQKALKQMISTATPAGAPDPFADQPAWIKEDREPTDVEVRSMTTEQLSAAFLARSRKQ